MGYSTTMVDRISIVRPSSADTEQPQVTTPDPCQLPGDLLGGDRRATGSHQTVTQLSPILRSRSGHMRIAGCRGSGLSQRSDVTVRSSGNKEVSRRSHRQHCRATGPPPESTTSSACDLSTTCGQPTTDTGPSDPGHQDDITTLRRSRSSARPRHRLPPCCCPLASPCGRSPGTARVLADDRSGAHAEQVHRSLIKVRSPCVLRNWQYIVQF